MIERPLRDLLESPAVHVAVLALACFGWLFRDLERPLTMDAVMYASISRTMVETGEWVQPSLRGEPYLNKPPLGLWLAAATMRAIGFTNRAAMLPSAVFGVLVVLALYAAVARVTGDRLAGLAAGGLLLFTPDFGRTVASFRFESMLVFFALTALMALERARERPAWFVAFWAAVGLGLMTKIAGGLLPLGIAIVTALVRRDPFPFHRGRFWLSAAVLVAVAAPWYIAMVARHGAGLWEVQVTEQTVERMVGFRWIGFDQILEYLLFPGFLLFLAPLAVPAVRAAAPGDPLRRAAAMVAVWILLIVGWLFTLRPGMDRERYMFYVMAPAAGLAGAGVARILGRWIDAPRAAAALGLAGAALLLANQLGVPLERSRTRALDELIDSARTLERAGTPVAFIWEYPYRAEDFARFHLGHGADAIPIDRVEEAVARRGQGFFAIVDRDGRRAVNAIGRPDVIVDANSYWLLRVRSAGAGAH